MNLKQLFLFAVSEKTFIYLRIWTAAISRASAVALWTVAIGTVTLDSSEMRKESDFDLRVCQSRVAIAI